MEIKVLEIANIEMVTVKSKALIICWWDTQ